MKRPVRTNQDHGAHTKPGHCAGCAATRHYPMWWRAQHCGTCGGVLEWIKVAPLAVAIQRRREDAAAEAGQRALTAISAGFADRAYAEARIAARHASKG